MDFDRVFLDTNILIDYVIDRKESAQSIKMIKQCILNRIELNISVSSVCTLMYLLDRAKVGLEIQKRTLLDISQAFTLINTKNENLASASYSLFNDLEDAILYFSAVSENCDALITRNVKDFINMGELPVYTPEVMLSFLVE